MEVSWSYFVKTMKTIILKCKDIMSLQKQYPCYSGWSKNNYFQCNYFSTIKIISM